MTYRTLRARRRALRRAVTDFPAILRSRRPGIHFTAVITATVHAEPDGLYDPDQTADHVREALRTAAADAVRDKDPIDLPAAQDACARHLRTHRTTASGTTASATARLTLAPQDRAAVDDLLNAARAQGVTDALESQRVQALASELAHPAALLAWLLHRPEVDPAKLPDEQALTGIARQLARYPHARNEPFEIQVLAILRDFFNQFPREEQKRMLMQLLADAMRAARQPAHAHALEELLSLDTEPATQAPAS